MQDARRGKRQNHAAFGSVDGRILGLSLLYLLPKNQLGSCCLNYLTLDFFWVEIRHPASRVPGVESTVS